MSRMEKTLRWVGNLLFPAVIVGSVIVSAYLQPMVISSPKIAADYQQQGSQTGYFTDPQPNSADWPAGIPKMLLAALKRTYGDRMPVAAGYYYFGRSSRPGWLGVPLFYGTEVLITADGRRSAIKSFSLFNWPLDRIETGRTPAKSWKLNDDQSVRTDAVAALRAMWLERAVLLLPLAQAKLNWQTDGPARLVAEIAGAGQLQLEFGGGRLIRARLGRDHITPSEYTDFGSYSLPIVWRGRWGQDGQTAFDLEGLVFNPPFAEEALKVRGG